MNQIALGIREAIHCRYRVSLAIAALIAAAVVYRFSRLVSHDVGWMLTSANQFLDGYGRLYQDIFFEVNPPLALFLTFPPVLFARATGLFDVDVLLIYVFLLASFSLILSALLLSRMPEIDKTLRNLLLLALALGLFVVPGPDFGQREHFLLIFTLPYLVLAAVRAQGHRPGIGLGVLCGVSAALGFSLKPHFLLVPALVEGYLLLRTKRPMQILRSEIIAMALAGFAYAAVIVTVTPEYLTEVVPLALDLYNDAIRNSLLKVLFRLETVLVPLSITMHVLLRKHQRHPVFGDIFAIAAAGLYVVYLIQMKGWYYQVLPSLAAGICTLLIAMSGLIEALAGQAGRQKEPRMGALALVLCLAIVGYSAFHNLSRSGPRSLFAAEMLPIVERHAPGGVIYCFSTNVSTGFPLVNYSRSRWGSRYSTLWPLPGIAKMQAAYQDLDAAERARLSEMETFMRNSVIGELLSHRPDLIILDRRDKKHYFGGLAFDYIEYFSTDPRFRSFWSEYEQVDDFASFFVFKRRPAVATQGD